MSDFQQAPPFRTFVDDLAGIVRGVLVKNSSAHGGRTLPAYLHFSMPGGERDSLHVGMAGTTEMRRELVETAVLPLVKATGPELVGWTFEGELDGTTVAVVVAIDRERSEVWFAPLARAMGQTLIGEFQPWPANQQAGTFITPIQEAMR
jgi:hypothetical protein